MRKILVVIDMQNDFIDGALGTKDAVSIVPKVVEKIKSYDSSNVYATMDTHYDYFKTQEGKLLPVEHCISGTKGWKLRKEIAELVKDNLFPKSTFGSSTLAGELNIISSKEDIEVELVGLCTDVCVVSNALLFKAIMPEVRISVDSSCCAGTTQEKHQAALEVMKSCQIIVS